MTDKDTTRAAPNETAEGRNAPSPRRVTEADGSSAEVFALSIEQADLEALLRDLFERNWDKIVFGPIVEGAAWEFRAAQPPSHISLFDGYITIAFAESHFHFCIGEHKGTRKNPTPPDLARRRRCARAELFRRLGPDDAPNSWGLRLFNGDGEQQATVWFPNPFLSADGRKVLKQPDWASLALWDDILSRHAGVAVPDPRDRLGKGFNHA
jgi:hypothetical protein